MSANVNNVRKLAQEYLEYFQVLDKQEVSFTTYATKDNAPQELKDLVLKAHGKMMPDNYIYTYIVESLQAIAENDTENLEKLDSLMEADVYNNDRLNWLSSHLDRPCYVDEYVEEFCLEIKADNFNIMELIGFGQAREKQEVFYSVLSSLEKIVSASIDDDDEEEDGLKDE